MGAFQAGALLASFEAGTWVDVVHGSSAGALSPGKVSGEPSVRPASRAHLRFAPAERVNGSGRRAVAGAGKHAITIGGGSGPRGDAAQELRCHEGHRPAARSSGRYQRGPASPPAVSSSVTAARPASNRATGTRKGLQET